MQEDEGLPSDLLSNCADHWQKVAMVIVRTTEKRGETIRSSLLFGPLGTGDEDVRLESYVAAIQSLIDNQRLDVQGDPANPRFSEIRLRS
ncbi:hypothetical protein [Mesorhizobium huakuii]|uniref:Uncharacterized protein n=1 Tax=Mesorhizobium huakuii TaxID=28104 RepID=A0ABZ0W2M4_9HYPH|nr:hypothetical protein [Mesorhizobium huakuii]WQC02227.1 hypothetical protein U0R22_006468 [Mesorhizobium huakuii]